jgi:3-hydroxybutyryl-CoA dehydratase
MELGIPAALGPWVVDSVSSESMRTLAQVLGDPNPIHLDRDAVAALGLGDRLINQGPANFAYIVNMLRDAAPAAEIRNLSVRLLSNVFEGERVEAAGEVVSVDGDAKERRVSCRVWLDGESGRALEGTATLVVSAARAMAQAP